MIAEPLLTGRRITILIGSFGWGGAERQALLLADGLRQRHGAVVSVAGLGGPGPATKRCADLAIPTCSLPRVESRWSLWCAWKIRTAARLLLRTLAPEAIAAFTAPANLVAGFAARHASVPAIWGQRDEGLFRFPSRLELTALAACDEAIANGPGAETFLRKMDPPPRRVSLISNGVVLPPPVRDRAAWRVQLGIPEGHLVVVMVANLTRAKDHQTLLKAWNRIEGDLPKAHLVLAGRDGDAGEAVRQTIADSGLSRVVLAGPVEDMAGLLSACDLSLLSSRSEGLPNVVLEAMSMGLPVIATDIPGCRSALGEGPLVPVGDETALATIIAKLLADPGMRTRLGEANQARIKQHFSPEAAIDQYAKHLKMSLDARSQRSSPHPLGIASD